MSPRSSLAAGAVALSLIIPSVIAAKVPSHAQSIESNWHGSTASPIQIALANQSRLQGLHINDLHLYPGVSIDYIRGKLGPDNERFKGEAGSIHYIWNIANKIRLAGEFDEIGSLLSVTISVAGAWYDRAYAVMGDSIIRPGKDSIRDIQHFSPYGCLEKKWGAENMELQRYLVRGGPEGTWAYGFSLDLEIGGVNGGRDLTRVPISSIELLYVDKLNAQDPRRGCSFR
jgi:hypothetical protein